MQALVLVLWLLMPSPAQDHVVIIGDSTASVDSHLPSHGSALNGYDWNVNSQVWTNFNGNAQTSWSPDLAFFWNSNKSRTLGIVNSAASGTHLGSTAAGGWGRTPLTLLSGAKTQWVNSGSPTISAVLVALGANDVGGDVLHSSSEWAASIATINTQIKADYGSTVPLYFNILADDTPTGADYRARMDAFRQGVLDAITAGSCLRGANWTGQVYADTTHPDTLALGAEIGRAWYLVLNSGTPAPALSVAAINTAKTVTRITLDRSLGNSISSSVAGFRVMDNGSSVAISSAVVISAQRIDLTHTAISGTATVSFASAEDAIGVTIPKGATQTLVDASTYQAPLVPFFTQAQIPLGANIPWLRA